MIKNEHQYKITKGLIAKFEKALSELKLGAHGRNNLHPRLMRAEKDAMASQLRDLRAELREFEKLKTGSHLFVPIASLEQLPQGLIKARIAKGLSQKQLAQKLGLREQQIQRYEADNYQSAKFGRLSAVANALGVQLVGKTK